MKETTRGVLGIAGAILLVAVIVVGGWQIGWWFRTQNVNRESHLIRNGYANQQTLRDQITQNISNVLDVSVQIAGAPAAQRPSLVAQRAAIVSIVCGDAAQVAGDPLDAQQSQFVDANCEAGAISPSSVYFANQ